MINIIKYDLYNGIRKRMIWLLLPIIVFTVGAFEIDGTVRLIQNEGGCMSLGECLAYYFHGSIPAGSELGASRPHIVWLIIQLGCFACQCQAQSHLKNSILPPDIRGLIGREILLDDVDGYLAAKGGFAVGLRRHLAEESDVFQLLVAVESMASEINDRGRNEKVSD